MANNLHEFVPLSLCIWKLKMPKIQRVKHFEKTKTNLQADIFEE